MGKHQIMSVPKEARGTSDWDMFATWVGGKCRQRNVVYRRSHCGLRVCGRNESFGIVVCRVLSVFESDRIHWLQDGRFDDGTEQNIFSILDDFVLLLRPRGPDLEPVVEHFSDFWRFCSTFGAARTGFGVSGRTFFQFLEILFYFRDRADRIWSRRQNIFPIFGDFVLLSRPRRPDLESAVEHFSDFWRFCSTFETAQTGFGVGGRTFFQFLEILFYFRGRADRIWSRRQNIFPIFGDFVLLSELRGPDLELAVEHFSNFWRFCSTSEAAHLNLDQPVDKKESFSPLFVYFRGRAP